MYDINQGDPMEMEEESRQSIDHRKSVLSYLHDLTYLLCGILVVFLLLFRVVVVSGTSMNNTLVDGDYILLLNNVFYNEPKQGDVIVASKESFGNGEPIIKRVIATEGQTVHIDGQNQKVYVDGKLLDEPYIASPTINYNFTQTVEKGCVFVMGDNRLNSKDSRSSEIGQIDKREILGKALFLVWPGKNPLTGKRDLGRIGVVSDGK